MNYEALFLSHKESKLYGRYITLDDIEPILSKLNTRNQLQVIRFSVLKRPIYAYEIGQGQTRILMWSQMHGNESTTTKALFDFLNLLGSKTTLAQQLLDRYTFCCIPMLNPDGAQVYTRENANQIDLNRDAQNLSQPESIALRKALDDFKPHYCFNLHDQRTIFGAGDTGKPATISFLAPAYNQERDMNATRLKAVQLIVSMNTVLQQLIPNQIGRFDDAFNINCTGDAFQFLKIPTILFEAGHFNHDYQREHSRKYLFIALVAGLLQHNENVIVGNEKDVYLNIPQNKVVFYDILYKNVKINYDSNKIITNFALQYKEELSESKICFIAYFAKIEDLDNYFGHFEYDAEGAEYSDQNENIPKLNQKADFCLDKNTIIVNGTIKI
ncbi:MAG: peptidase M14 [Burkholderiales bacterium]|nr:peptidase M14 [Flavobacterium sp.]